MALLIFIALLVALIWVHELGHFTAAKLFGIRVDEFAIGFPPRLLRVRWGETNYTFNLLLLGGFVRIHGEDAQEGKGDPRSMATKPRPVQAAVIVAGVAMNILFAWLILSTGYMVGLPASTDHSGLGEVRNAQVAVVQVLPGSPAEKAGMRAGDELKSITAGSGSIELAAGDHGEKAQQFIGAHQDESLIFSINRRGEEVSLLVKAEAGIVEDKKVVGIVMDDVGLLRLPVHLALAQGVISTKDLTVSTAQGLWSFFSQVARGSAQWNDVAGPVGIAGVGSGAVKEGFASAAFITALISINLAIINLLPIPGLDGGRLLIIGIESIIRRPISVKVVNVLSLGGLALIVLLMLVVTYHDILRLVG